MTHSILGANADTSIPAAPTIPDMKAIPLIGHRSAICPTKGAVEKILVDIDIGAK